MKMRLRTWWKKNFGATAVQWQWGHPDEWSDEEWYDWKRSRQRGNSVY